LELLLYKLVLILTPRSEEKLLETVLNHTDKFYETMTPIILFLDEENLIIRGTLQEI
jgi:hypothetical protein